MSDALFERDGERYLPSPHTRGPWDERAQHGGPPAALLARAMEAVEGEAPMRVARFSIDILRPVPLQPLTLEARVEHGGRRVQFLGAVLRAADQEVCRATAVRIRSTQLALPAVTAAPYPPGAPETLSPHPPESDEPAFHRTGVEMRFASGAMTQLGPAQAWIRLRHPIVEGETPSPLQRAVAAADFGNGVSAELDWTHHLFINPDLTVYLHREPVGEWICLDARTFLDAGGIGLAESALHDTTGPVGRSLQSLLLDELRPRGAIMSA